MEALISLLVREQGISEINLPDKMVEKKIVPAPKELFVNQICPENTKTLLDGIVLLANQDAFLKEMSDMELGELLGKLKFKHAFGESIQKVEVLQA